MDADMMEAYDDLMGLCVVNVGEADFDVSEP
jgi:hypothetical protein